MRQRKRLKRRTARPHLEFSFKRFQLLTIMKTLVIVESPTKAKTISQFLGKDFDVQSSFGHVRDLPKSTLGVDVEHDFTPKYIVPLKAKKNVTALKKKAAKAGEIVLATDEDREGEAIAWHLAQALELDKIKDENKEIKISRIAFHEITKKAIDEALEHPREIDMNMVNAQQTRRILDRLLGDKSSAWTLCGEGAVGRGAADCGS